MDVSVRRGTGPTTATGTVPEPPVPIGEIVNWLTEQTWSEFAQSLATYYARKGYLTERQEAAARSMHAKVTGKPDPREVPVPEDGFYRVDGDIFRVQKARSSDNRYAKRLVIDDEDDGVSRGWVYVGRKPFAKLTADTRLTLADAQAHGLAHGWCLSCGRELTVPESVERGIGPVCAKKWQ